jgi:hypothetical protein
MNSLDIFYEYPFSEKDFKVIHTIIHMTVATLEAD